MDLKQFWDVIDTVQDKAEGGQGRMLEELSALLGQLDTEDIMQYSLIFNELHERADKMKLLAAAYAINGGCSDDCFDSFRRWLIFQGRDVYLAALKEPESLADLGEELLADTEFEDIHDVPMQAWCKKEGLSAKDFDAFEEELDKYCLSDETLEEIEAEILYSDDMDEDWEEDDLPQMMPILCKMFEN